MNLTELATLLWVVVGRPSITPGTEAFQKLVDAGLIEPRFGRPGEPDQHAVTEHGATVLGRILSRVMQPNPRPAEPPGSPTAVEPVDVPGQPRRECWVGTVREQEHIIRFNEVSAWQDLTEPAHMVELRPGETIAPHGAVVLTREQAMRRVQQRLSRRYPAPDTDAALAARNKRIAELEEWQAEARDALLEADKHLASLQQVEAELAQANAEADESQRQRQIDALSAALEGETQRADRAEAERDAAMRKAVDEE